MKKYRKFWVPASGRSASIAVDPRTLTVPDVVPSLKEIILSGSGQLVGARLFDDSEAEGVKRLFAQGAPLEMILSAQLDGFPPEGEEKKESQATPPTEPEGEAGKAGAEGSASEPSK